MMKKIRIIVLLLLATGYLTAQGDSAKVTFSGQLTGWGIGQFQEPFGLQFGGRFVPTMLGNMNVTPKAKLDFEASLQINGSLNFTGLQYDSVIGLLKPYRVWVRYSRGPWEVRLGLQKINFGSAKMFRPLMWFDAMDVRDPLRLTDGVYGALGRYYFLNNANVWLWTLIGNKNPKGYERWGSDTWKPEYGGRFQTPAGPGEMALSTHFRKVNVNTVLPLVPEKTLLDESRIGLDGKWDVGIGLWFESSVSVTEANPYGISRVQDTWNLGADYTLPWGNGLGVTLEYFRFHAGPRFMTGGMGANLLGSMFSYPLSMLDNISAMVFYIPGPNMFLNYANWSRTYDNWSLYAIAYWNPDNFQLPTAQSQGRNLFAGKGIQLMVNYNF